jgi:hypothetical protein
MKLYPIQGSENSTTLDIKQVFEKVYGDLVNKHVEPYRPYRLDELKQYLVIVFDEIGLAEKSPDNPLKVLHPYL